MGVFKANDIRGVYPGELTPALVYAVGYHLPGVLNASRIVVGRDTRTSSDAVFKLLTDGITDAGADIVDIGVCDTPALYFATAHYEFAGSVMITASHNPPAYNGLKISMAQAVPLGPATGLTTLKRLTDTAPSPPRAKGAVSFLDITRDYREHVLQFADDLTGVSAVIDCGNGAAATFVHQIFGPTNLKYTAIFDEPDGLFPNHGPNPLEQGSWIPIREQIRQSGVQLGVLFDGDADRAVFFDEEGNFISPDIITSLIGHRYYGAAGPGSTMFYDIRSSRSVADYVVALGGTAAPCPTGHATIKRMLREANGTYAGELSGHYYFRENFFCDSGFIAAVMVLSIVKSLGRPVSRLVSAVNPYAFSGEINFEVRDQEFVLAELRRLYPDGSVNALDGIRIDYDSWWFIVRPSGAEPVLRLVVEAENSELLSQKVRELKEAITRLDRVSMQRSKL